MPQKSSRPTKGYGGRGTAKGGRSAPRPTPMLPQITTVLSEEPDPTERDLLTLVQSIFRPLFAAPVALAATIQTVKKSLFERDYLNAFSLPEYLRAYVVRWSPSRALCYAHVIDRLDILAAAGGRDPATDEILPSRWLCIGGGAGGEVLALAWNARKHAVSGVDVTAVDIADWADVFDDIRGGLDRKWDMQPTADHECQDADAVDSAKLEFTMDFRELDILDATCAAEAGASVDGEPAVEPLVDFSSFDVITSLFTTNELFAQSRVRTMKLLSLITETAKPGTLFLVIESAGSYSDITVGSRTFPLHFLLDHALEMGWKCVHKNDATWFRVPEDFKYPLQLENMRFFVRLYRKL
ncbi:uncharacterized protein V1510DRAFT_419569 [Dipodascopsis tothii]|uniref:uncharacterized protein n=1 Tax=Dipodascopsis tothii TaxID=44089 RepID=UPI0034CDA7C6